LPRQRKSARLYLRQERHDRNGKLKQSAGWVILDRGKEVSTGCGPDDGAEAERRLSRYLAEKHEAPRRERSLSQTLIADVINIYLRDVAPDLASPKKVADASVRLIEFFGNATLADISGELCRAYVAHREQAGFARSAGGARRDLQDLAAAINHHHREGLHRELVRVVLPAQGESRKRWLTRSEVSRLALGCIITREAQGAVATKRRPLAHLARFILIGVYTGSRPGAILSLSWNEEIGRGWVDLEHGLIYRMKEGAQANNKRQPPVPIAPELWRLMRRWARKDEHRGPVVRFNEQPVLSVKTSLKRAVHLAGLDTSVTGYTLRHTAASWLVQSGMSFAKVAAFLGTSEAMVDRHYAHLAPDHLRDVADAIGRNHGGKRGGRLKQRAGDAA
jgi:integrase